jgi:hypothetical protein
MGKTWHNKAVNADAFSVRCAHYKCAGYGWRCVCFGSVPVAAGQSVLRQLRQAKQTSTVGLRWAAVEAYPTPTAGRGNLHGPPQSSRPAAPIARATRR